NPSIESATSLPISGSRRNTGAGMLRTNSSRPSQLARVFAVLSPICMMPSANRNRGKVVCLLAAMPSTRFSAHLVATFPAFTVSGVVPSRSSARCFMSTKSSTVRRYRSAGVFTMSNSTSASAKRSPRPSMSIARRAAKWISAPFAQQRRATYRAMRRHRPWHGAFGAQLLHDPHHFGNHVAGPTHDHRVADAHIQSRDLVGVVQGGVGHGDTGHLHRLHARARGGCAGAADLHLDVEQPGA